MALLTRGVSPLPAMKPGRPNAGDTEVTTPSEIASEMAPGAAVLRSRHERGCPGENGSRAENGGRTRPVFCMIMGPETRRMLDNKNTAPEKMARHKKTAAACDPSANLLDAEAW